MYHTAEQQVEDPVLEEKVYVIKRLENNIARITSVPMKNSG